MFFEELYITLMLPFCVLFQKKQERAGGKYEAPARLFYKWTKKVSASAETFSHCDESKHAASYDCKVLGRVKNYSCWQKKFQALSARLCQAGSSLQDCRIVSFESLRSKIRTTGYPCLDTQYYKNETQVNICQGGFHHKDEIPLDRNIRML